MRLAPLVLTGCLLSLAPTLPARISCEADADCRDGKTCGQRIRLCLDDSDVTPPQLRGALPHSSTRVRITFSEPLALAPPSGFTITPPLAIESAELVADGSEVELQVTPQTPGTLYHLSVAGAIDLGELDLVTPNDVTFTGFGSGGNRAPPAPLLPEDGGVVSGVSARLVWSRRAQAKTYAVDIATDAAFTQVLQSFSVDDPATEVSVTLSEPITHYWRVRADNTLPDQYGQARFDLLGGIVHVRAGATSALGSKSNPAGKISDGVSVAVVHGLTELRVSGDFTEHPTLPSGMTLLGGYAADFGARDGLSRVDSLGLVATRGLRVSGLRVTGDIYVGPSTSAIAFDTLEVGGRFITDGAGYGNAPITVRDALISGGMVLNNGTVDMRAVTVLASSARALDMTNADSEIRDSMFVGAGDAVESSGITLAGGALTLINTIAMGGDAPTSYGAYLPGRPHHVINNAFITGALADTGVALVVGQSEVVNNLLVAQGGSGATCCVGYDPATSRGPDRLLANSFAQCAKLYRKYESVTPLTLITDVNDPTKTTMAGTGSTQANTLFSVSELTAFPSDLRPLPSASTGVLHGGFGPTGVTGDREGAPRACVTPAVDCYTRGPYEAH